MADVLIPRPRGPVRGRPFAKGQSGHPAGRPAGARNKKTLAAAVLLDGEAEALTRRAVELAFAGDPMALRLCIERILPPCRERTVKFVACTAPGRVGASTLRRDFAADSLQMARGAIVDAIRDCGAPAPGQVCLLQNSASTSWRGGCFRPTGGAPQCCRAQRDRHESAPCR